MAIRRGDNWFDSLMGTGDGGAVSAQDKGAVGACGPAAAAAAGPQAAGSGGGGRAGSGCRKALHWLTREDSIEDSRLSQPHSSINSSSSWQSSAAAPARRCALRGRSAAATSALPRSLRRAATDWMPSCICGRGGGAHCGGDAGRQG